MRVMRWIQGGLVMGLVVFMVLSSPATGYAGSEDGNAGGGHGEDENYVNIEEAMREYNARYMYFQAKSLNVNNDSPDVVTKDEIRKAPFVEWPQCKGCGGGKGSAPSKPEDETYKISMQDKNEAVEIVAAVVKEFYTAEVDLVPLYAKFVKVEGVEGDPSSFSNYIESDFPLTWVAGSPSYSGDSPAGNNSQHGVTLDNYGEVAETITGYIKELVATGTSGSQPSWTGIDTDSGEREVRDISFSVSGLGDFPSIDAFTSAYEDAWNASPLILAPGFINPHPTVEGEISISYDQVDDEFRGQNSTGVTQIGGRLKLTGQSNASYAVYLRAQSFPSNNTPIAPGLPIEPDEKWHLFTEFQGAGPHFSEPVGDIELDWEEFLGGIPPQNQWQGSTYQADLHSWAVLGYKAFETLDFDSSANGGCDLPACTESCSANMGGDNSLKSLHSRYGLGMLDDETTAGYVQIHAHEPDAAIFTPDMLEVVTDSSVEVIRGSNDTLRQVKTDDLLADVVVNSSTEYEIRYYHVDASDETIDQLNPTKDSNGYWEPETSAIPFRTIVVEQPGASINNVRFTEKDETEAVTLVNEFVWDGTDTWDLYEGMDKSTPTLTSAVRRQSKQIVVASNTRTETMKSMTANYDGAGTGELLSHMEEVYTQYPFGWVLTSSAVDPDGFNLVETWTYYTTRGEDGYGKVKTYTSKTGYWEHYVYDSDNVLSKTIRQRDGNLYDGSDISTLGDDNVVTEIYEELLEDVDVDGTTEDVFVIRTTILDQGTPEQVAYVLYRDGCDISTNNLDEVWRVRCATSTPEGAGTLEDFVEGMLEGTNGDGHLVTKTWTYKADFVYDTMADESYEAHAEPFDVARMVSPDGQATFYDYTADRTSVVERGYMTDPLATTPVVIYGTRSTSVVDAQGNAVSSKSEKKTQDVTGGWFITSFMKTADTDDYGRPTETAYYFGEEAADEAASSGGGTAAYSTEIDYGTSCCGGDDAITRTGRDGVEHKTYPDDLGRTEKSVRAANVTSAKITSLMFYDAAGRVVVQGIDENEDGDLDDALDLKTVTAYDAAGRLKSTTDPEGRKTHMTYRRINTDGSAFTGTVGADVFYWETRSYGHNDEVPVSVTWTNSQGNTVRSWTGSLTGWDGTSDPTGSEVLTEHTRSTSVYDWANRMTEGRAYFDLDATDGPGTSYLVTSKSEYDVLGRGYRSTDASGNITETVYEDGTGRSIKTLIGIDEDNDGDFEASEQHVVSRVFYKTFDNNGDLEHDRPWPTRVYTVAPGLTSAPSDSGLDHATAPSSTDYTYTETVEAYTVATSSSNDYLSRRFMWSRPEYGPWSRQATDEEGRPANSRTYKNGDDTYELTRTVYTYWDTNDASDGKLYLTKQYRVTGGAATSNYLETRHLYDDAGRQVKINNIGRGFTKTEYDAYGRTKRTAFGSYEGTTGDVTNFTDDTLLTETMPTYDKSGRVTGTATYERTHDATATGLLSAAAADQVRVSYSYTWFDDNGRTTHSATVGTDASYTYNAASPPTPNTSDDVLVTKVEYDDAGRAYLTTDNLGRQNRTFFDDLGRVTHSVENWDGSLTTPDAPSSRDADVNRITKTIYDNSSSGGGARIATVAVDPDSDGNTGDNQSTLYIHSGEIDEDERGYIPVNGRPVAVLMPDALEDGETRSGAITKINNGTSGGDFAFTEYYANGQAKRTTDARGVQRNAFYTDEGWPDYTTVTEASGNTWDSVGDLRTAYTYGDAGEPLTITTYSDTAGTTATSKITYTYDGFYNRLTEKQDHDPTANSGAGDPKTISWAFDTSLSGSYYDKAYRLDTITYPNGRVLQLNYDGHTVDGYSIDDRIGRPNAIEEDSSGDDIVSYSYLGGGRMVRKDYPTPDVRLDFVDESGEGSDANDDYEVSLDAFGRPLRYQWETYDPGTGDADEDLIHLAHGYDRNSNRLYDERKADNGVSKLYERDELDRITGNTRGVLTDDGGTKGTYFNRLKGIYDLDALGNPTEIDYKGATPYVKNITHNDANELDTREVYERAASALVQDAFGSDTKANWDIPGSDDFNITGGYLQPTTVSADTIDGTLESDPHALFLWGPELGPVANETYFTFDASITTTTRAGFVFGYEDAHNYWIVVLKYVPGGQSKKEICQVVNGVLTVLSSSNTTINTGTEYNTHIGSTRKHIRNSGQQYDFSTGYPGGRIGIYTDNAAVKFNKFLVWPKDAPSDLAGRWDRYSSAESASDGIGVYNTDTKRYYPTLLRGVTTPADESWRTTFKMKRSTATRNRDGLRFLFNVRDHDTYSRLVIEHAATAQNVWGSEWLEGTDGTYSPGSSDITAVPAIASSGTPMWVHIEYDDDTDTITVKLKDGTTEPTDWSAISAAYTSSNFNMTGGGIGFHSHHGAATVKYVRVETDANDDDTFVTEYEDTMGGWASYEPIEHEHDAAGNLTYDGEKWYSYDAFNRLVRVSNAYRDDNDDIQVGSPLAEFAYDGSSRRITKDTYLGGVLDNVEHFYYHGQSLVETRNGSDQVIQQHVWDNLAGHYIDSLAQVIKKAGPTQFSDQQYFPLQDQQFNILAIVDDQGTLVERYEYSLYGKRQVINDQGVSIASSAYGMQMGFQGLYHDDESRLVYNRARMLIPALDRFLQRDPLGYPDGINTYAAYHVMRGGLDPSGRVVIFVHGILNYNVGDFDDVAAGIKKTWAQNDWGEQAFVHFLYEDWLLGGVPSLAVAKAGIYSRTNNKAAHRLSRLISRLNAERSRNNSCEKIHVVAYSNGANVVYRALQTGLMQFGDTPKVDNILIIGGSVDADVDWNQEMGVLDGKIYNYWHPEDGSATSVVDGVGYQGIGTTDGSPNAPLVADGSIVNVKPNVYGVYHSQGQLESVTGLDVPSETEGPVYKTRLRTNRRYSYTHWMTNYMGQAYGAHLDPGKDLILSKKGSLPDGTKLNQDYHLWKPTIGKYGSVVDAP